MENLQKIAKEIGSNYNYRNLTAKFSPEKDLKVCWMRMGPAIDFWVSDYLKGAPKDVLDDVLNTIFKRITGVNANYTEQTVEYLTSDEFLKKNQKLYTSRVPGIDVSPIGRHNDLAEAYERLLDKGLVKADADMILCWAPTESNVGHSSVLFKAAVVNRRLDNPFMNDDLLDFCLYSQIAFIQLGFIQDNDVRKEEYEAALEKYPNHKQYINDLSQMGLKLDNRM